MIVLLNVLLVAVAGAPVENVAPVARAVVAPAPIRVDGLLNEPVWQASLPAAGFRQREPEEGAAATEATEVRTVYTQDTLYIGIHAFDREPDKIVARILQRDRLLEAGGDGAFHVASDDVVALILDPFLDRRNAFLFATNANGAQFDALITDEGAAWNADWRGVWDVAARRTEDGWSAEFAIPFRTLRYPWTERPSSWGLNVERVIRRKQEDTLWASWWRAGGGLHRISQAGTLEGLHDLPRPGFNAEVKPYGLAGVLQDNQTGAEHVAYRWSAGADLKWELRPGLVLDGTVHPDFAQVEADQQIVNLSRFELYFPEKRDFFLENAGIFDFGTRGTSEFPPFLMFFSRRIGLDNGTEEPIVGGVRLSGRAGRQTIGVMDVVTAPIGDDRHANFGVVRLKRDVGRRSYIGGMITDRRSETSAATDLGVDASIWPTARLNLQGFAARTATDRSNDVACRASAEYSGDPVYVFAKYLVVGPDAGTAMGFVTRTDIRRANAKVQYTARPRALGLRQIDLYAGGKHITSTTSEPQDGNWFPGVSLTWNSGESVSVTNVRGFTVVDGAFLLAGRVPVERGRYDLRDTEVSVNTSTKRPVAFFGQASLLRLFDGQLYSWTGTLQLQHGSHLSTGATYTRSDVDLPGGAFVAHVPGLRIGWTQSTRLAAATYLQYDTLNRRFLGNVRLDFIHRPGSDLFLVVDEDRDLDEPAQLSRGVALKVTYLVRF